MQPRSTCATVVPDAAAVQNKCLVALLSFRLQASTPSGFVRGISDRDGIGCSAHVSWTKELLLRTLSQRPEIAFGPLASEVIEHVPVQTTHLNKIGAAKRKAGLLNVDLRNGKRTPSPETELWALTCASSNDYGRLMV